MEFDSLRRRRSPTTLEAQEQRTVGNSIILPATLGGDRRAGAEGITRIQEQNGKCSGGKKRSNLVADGFSTE